MADFIFRIDSVHLTEDQQQKIASAIQGAVLTELAKLDLHGDESKYKATAQATASPFGGSLLYAPITWRGGIMFPPSEVQAALNSNLGVVNKATDKTRAA